MPFLRSDSKIDVYLSSTLAEYMGGLPPSLGVITDTFEEGGSLLTRELEDTDSDIELWTPTGLQGGIATLQYVAIVADKTFSIRLRDSGSTSNGYITCRKADSGLGKFEQSLDMSAASTGVWLKGVSGQGQAKVYYILAGT